MKCGMMIGTVLCVLGSSARAVAPAPLIHDKRIHGQTVKLEVGQRLEVQLGGGCFTKAVAIGGDSVECLNDGEPSRQEGRRDTFDFQARKPGRTRILLAYYGPGAKSRITDFAVEVTGAGKATAAAEIPLLLFGGSENETFTIPVGRKIEFRLPIDAEGGVWKVVSVEGDGVRHDADPKDKAASRVLKFTGSKAGRTVITLERIESSRDIDLKVYIDVKDAGKNLTPDTF